MSETERRPFDLAESPNVMGIGGRLSSVVLAAALVAVVCASEAWGTPRVAFKVRAVPIVGFQHTGNIAGAGAAIQVEYTITGTEYAGFPPPLIGLSMYMPAGMLVYPRNFPTCQFTIVSVPPHFCPLGSRAGPVGSMQGFVAFGEQILQESATVQPYYGPNGELRLEILGHDPVLLEVPVRGYYAEAHGPYTRSLDAKLPLVETVPGAQDVSISRLAVRLGTAIRLAGRVTSYFRMPATCKWGDLPWMAELTFAGVGGLSPQTVTARYQAPCPRRR